MKLLDTKSDTSYYHHVTASAGKQLVVASWHTNFSGLNYFHAGFLPFVLHIEHPEAVEHTEFVSKRHAQPRVDKAT